ncbi:MAG: hypothetical protein ABIU63_04630 [Chitinophagaceae bacterium]
MYTQQTPSTIYRNISSFLSTPEAQRFLKPVLFLGAFLSISVYAWVRLLFHDLPFNIFEETTLIVRILLAGWTMAALCIGGFNIVVYIVENPVRVYKKITGVKWHLVKPVVLIILVSVLFACSGAKVGINRNINTGMVTTSRGLATGSTKMTLNDAVLDQPDIPLGASFVIINEGIKGLTVKDGKCAVGCALLITDKKGKVLLSEADLFKGNGIFEKENAGQLRCLVSTGKPMKLEQQYNVSVVFTDKYGSGSVENKVAIRPIDLP